MEFLKTATKYFGTKKIEAITLIVLGAIGWMTIPEYVVTQEQLQSYDEKQQRTHAIFELQMLGLEEKQLNADLYQLKKLRKQGMADQDDLDRMDEVKEQLKELRAKKDSLQQFIKDQKKLKDD